MYIYTHAMISLLGVEGGKRVAKVFCQKGPVKRNFIVMKNKIKNNMFIHKCSCSQH